MSQSKMKDCIMCGKYKSFYNLKDEHCRSCYMRILHADSEVDPSIQKRCNKCNEIYKLSEFSTPRGALNSYCRNCNNLLITQWKSSKQPIKQLNKAMNTLYECILNSKLQDSTLEADINALEKRIKRQLIV
jgi:hypothetical protein